MATPETPQQDYILHSTYTANYTQYTQALVVISSREPCLEKHTASDSKKLTARSIVRKIFGIDVGYLHLPLRYQYLSAYVNCPAYSNYTSPKAPVLSLTLVRTSTLSYVLYLCTLVLTSTALLTPNLYMQSSLSTVPCPAGLCRPESRSLRWTQWGEGKGTISKGPDRIVML